MAKENVFVRYLSKKYDDMEKTPREAGPVITISREFGCDAPAIADKIILKLNAKYAKSHSQKLWSIISKEVLGHAAQELQTNPAKISHIFDGKGKGFFDNLAESFMKYYYLPDNRIIKTIKNVIKSYAWQGNVVIVGRASCAITKDVPKALHIKLIAPFEYRAKRIAEKYDIPVKDAREQVVSVDEKRNAFMKFFTGDKPELDHYDVILNKSRYDEDYIVDLIIRLAEDKKLVSFL